MSLLPTRITVDVGFVCLAVVLALEPPEAVRAVLIADEAAYLDVVRMSHFDFSGTPAIVVVDARNRVVASWLGRLSPALEEQVIGTVEGLAR